MYKIKVLNNETGNVWYEYGFTKYMMKRIHYLFNDTYIRNGFPHNLYEVLEVHKIIFTRKTFKKCLTNAVEYITILE